MYFILFLFVGCISFYFYFWDVFLSTVEFFLVLRFSSRAKNLVPVINDICGQDVSVGSPQKDPTKMAGRMCRSLTRMWRFRVLPWVMDGDGESM
jgi:hypothetical protein